MRNILIIDDEFITREILKSILSDEDYNLSFAENGEIGLQKAAKFDPDLILLDIVMPGIDGFEVCRQIRIDPYLSEVPIVFISSMNDKDSHLKGIEAGADDFISKPFDKYEILVRVQTITRLNRYRKLLSGRIEQDKLNKTISILEHEATLGNIAAGIAHDFSNILASLQSVEIMQNYFDDIENVIPGKYRERCYDKFQSLKRYCFHIKETIALGRTLTKGITDFASGAKYEGKYKQSIVPHIQKPFDIFKKKLKSSNILLTMDIEPDLPKVFINSGEIQRVILNLITNAVYAVEKAKMSNRKLFVRAWQQGNSIKLSIKDNGVGIPDHIQNKIFDHLFTTKKQGSGIGLSTVKRILDNHNADIDIKSQPGKGTCFTITFFL
jgi:signal transduction histidine kinase